MKYIFLFRFDKNYPLIKRQNVKNLKHMLLFSFKKNKKTFQIENNSKFDYKLYSHKINLVVRK